MPTTTDPKFSLGQTVSTSNAQNTLKQEDVLKAMGRHSRGDWGDLCEEDRQANEQAARTRRAPILGLPRS